MTTKSTRCRRRWSVVLLVQVLASFLLVELCLCHALNESDYLARANSNNEEFQSAQTTEEKVKVILGEVYFPRPDRETCGVAIRANKFRCNARIAQHPNRSCECYDFCGDQLMNCYDRGYTPRTFDCAQEEDQMVTGCFVNFTKPTYFDWEPNPCPPGYICSRDEETNCDVLRNVTIALRLGDVHAGIYCPGTKDRTQGIGYKNCPIGYYCPNSTTKIVCPEGFFCPHKTAKPQIICKTCEEGAQNLLREEYGYIAMFATLGLLVLLMVLFLIKRSNQKLVDRLSDMQEMSLFSVRNAINYRSRKKKLTELKPKLKVIENRLNKMHNVDNVIATETASGDVKFDAKQLFDMLDADGNGELSYQELNEALQLRPAALREFAARMNKAGNEPAGTTTISRAVFVKFFLIALEASSNFEPTEEEAAQLYDAIAAHADTINGAVPSGQFYHSQLTEFLTDAEIHDLIGRFKDLQAMEGDIDDQESQAGGSQKFKSQRNNGSTRYGSTRSNGSYRGGYHRGRSVYGFFGNNAPKVHVVTRQEFIARYPLLLLEVTAHKESVPSERIDKVGVDLAFDNLSLTVNVKGKGIKVVNDVSGRLRSGTMTALMGGSGAGKTSLLNALCGRAFYGEVTGTIKINGHNSTIEEHASSVGFVPQDDIVYAELTVRENLIFSGKFQLPMGTPLEEIEDLADKTMAGLGLSRVMHSMVGDVRRRGVSGGEKKRVNIGLELMSRPKILFLDEPTSGLDASSAMLVMGSMKKLVEEGMTICSVIHQPRKFIFDLFDSLILLGVGGHIVYHGKVKKSEKYFKNLDYVLPEGESLADWLIDISSGRLGPEVFDDDNEADSRGRKKRRKSRREQPRSRSGSRSRSRSKGTESDDESHDGPKARLSNKNDEDPSMMASEAETEKARREHLYNCWRKHFKNNLSKKQRSMFDAPEPFDLPRPIKRAGFLKQLSYQLHRLIMLAIRNWYIKLIDTMLIVGGVVLTSVMAGVVEPTRPDPLSTLDYYALAEPTGNALVAVKSLMGQFPLLFRFALEGNLKIISYANQCGVVVAVLVGLTATKTITEKRNEFFREAGSGYNIDAYFCAVNLIATVEHGLQVMVSSMIALWLRNSLVNWYFFYVNFLMLSWLCVSWALVFPLLVPPSNVVLVTGFYMCFFALMFSGGVPPVRYPQLYSSPFLQIFCGLLSPTRFFVEAMAASESRCLPAQSGFTELGEIVQDVEDVGQVASFKIVGQGMNDFGTVTTRACGGWYWGFLPSAVIGITIRWIALGLNHVSCRPQQAKKPLFVTLARRPRSQLILSLYLTVLIGLGALSTWLLFWTPTYRAEPTNQSASAETGADDD